MMFMTIDVVSEFISNVGFPIAVTGALFYQMIKTSEANQRTFQDFKLIIQENTTSINQMNQVVKELKAIVTELKYQRQFHEQRKGDDNDV